MIEVRNLVKKYGDHAAVDDLTFTVEQGQIYGFLGPNGAGKSTTMNIITGCLAATSGEVRIDGHDIFKEPRAAKALIGYLPEQPPLYPDMTPREYLDFVAQVKGVGKKQQRAEAVLSVMEKTGIVDVQDRLIKNLSKGYKQRVGLAQAILGDPQVIILDEPTVGLDPAQIVEIRGVIKSLAEDHTVIFSSHILSEVSEICSRILIISGGKLVAEDTPEALESRFVSAPVLYATVKGDPDSIESALRSVEGVTDVELSAAKEDGTTDVTVQCASGAEVLEAISLALLQNGCLLLRMEEGRASLEDVFMELIAQEPAPQAPQDTDATPEFDADALLNGTVESAYAQHSPFDSPTEPDEEAPAAEDSPVNDTTETIDDAQEGGEADDSDL
ncbi:MAG: ABC transporter ATP-binding protein [Clostridia bacterium]|nr:ABC transporter ATP-binding protein [Clostridia bacterium]